MSYETITLEVEDGLAHLTLNRPEAANALNPAMASDLRRAAVHLAHAPGVRAILLTAARRRSAAMAGFRALAASGRFSVRWARPSSTSSVMVS